MSKHFTMAHDDMIVRFIDVMGADHLSKYDLPFSRASIVLRAKKLRDTGAWNYLVEMNKNFVLYHRAIGHAPLLSYDDPDEEAA